MNTRSKTDKTKKASAPETRTPRNLKPGTIVEDIYTGAINTVKCAYWQAYAGGNTSDYTVEFEPTREQPTGWNKSTNLRVISAPEDKTVSANQNRAMAKDAAITGLPTLDPNDMPTPAQRRKWAKEYRDAQDGALKLIPAAKTATACQKTPEVIHCEIRDQFGDVESAGTVLTSLEAYHWYENHGANFDCAKMNDSGFTFQRPPEAIECEPQTDIENGATLGALLAKHKPQAEHSRLPWRASGNFTQAEADACNQAEAQHLRQVTIGEHGMLFALKNGNEILALSPIREPLVALAKAYNHAEALAEALRDVDLRTTQARIASGIGKRKNRTEFLLGELERIASVAREALANWEGAK